MQLVFPAGGHLATHEVVGGASFSDSTSLHKATVPAGKRWLVYGGAVNRDNSGTLIVSFRTTTPKYLHRWCSDAAATGVRPFPTSVDDEDEGICCPMPLGPGEYVQFDFGAAQGAGATIAFKYIEVDD